LGQGGFTRWRGGGGGGGGGRGFGVGFGCDAESGGDHTLQHPATHCNILQHTTAHRNSDTESGVVVVDSVAAMAGVARLVEGGDTKNAQGVVGDAESGDGESGVGESGVGESGVGIDAPPRSLAAHTATHCNTPQHASTVSAGAVVQNASVAVKTIGAPGVAAGRGEGGGGLEADDLPCTQQGGGGNGGGGFEGAGAPHETQKPLCDSLGVALLGDDARIDGMTELDQQQESEQEREVRRANEEEEEEEEERDLMRRAQLILDGEKGREVLLTRQKEIYVYEKRPVKETCKHEKNLQKRRICMTGDL